MSDIHIRREGCAGRITLARPRALNALTHRMCRQIDAALADWAQDDAVSLVIFDAEGDRAFCAGGDISHVYRDAVRGDFGSAQAFWRDEYRMNRRIFRFAKPVVSFLHGFVMGGGVGIGCHAAHRVVDTGAQIAMPEVGIGLVPDVGGSLLLARAPGRLGEYLSTTGTRMSAADSIFAGFADLHVPRDAWPGLIARLSEDGDRAPLADAATPAGDSTLARQQPDIDRLFDVDTLPGIVAALEADDSDLAHAALGRLEAASPLSAACALELVRRVRRADTIEDALRHEYRFTHRAMEQADLLEGIRAKVIDKDGAPRWRHGGADDVTEAEVAALLAPLDPDPLDLGDAT
ncbi:enoyl-CoA hydratase/isomerase family protein [Tranquillimonas alkanivorans]|uniref:3-hydroxyisobutyryl-CoA hydrolase n=1 Tax=Tranquillimonas alkanivorans TaxID=441119 RepID=A0A1I5RES7_9RHOB|nr:enoyl-CoA hydratase/isomerase family protein [Tranquillimonas alkanivorans]SFP56985.1 enoyl-CoA hydratase [Tranquillimonas alkanivorans]